MKTGKLVRLGVFWIIPCLSAQVGFASHFYGGRCSQIKEAVTNWANNLKEPMDAHKFALNLHGSSKQENIGQVVVARAPSSTASYGCEDKTDPGNGIRDVQAKFSITKMKVTLSSAKVTSTCKKKSFINNEKAQLYTLDYTKEFSVAGELHTIDNGDYILVDFDINDGTETFSSTAEPCPAVQGLIKDALDQEKLFQGFRNSFFDNLLRNELYACAEDKKKELLDLAKQLNQDKVTELWVKRRLKKDWERLGKTSLKFELEDDSWDVGCLPREHSGKAWQFVTKPGKRAKFTLSFELDSKQDCKVNNKGEGSLKPGKYLVVRYLKISVVNERYSKWLPKVTLEGKYEDQDSDDKKKNPSRVTDSCKLVDAQFDSFGDILDEHFGQNY